VTNELSVKSENIFYRWNEHYKIIEAVDAISGEVIALQADFNEEHLLNPNNMIQLNIDGKSMLVQKGMSLSNYIPQKFNYSKLIADVVLQRVSEGQTLKKACLNLGVTPSTVLKWCDKIQSFSDDLNKARMIRAEMVQDTIIDTAEELSTGNLSKSEIDGKVRAAELLKWSAEKDSPNRFGNKKESGGSGATVIQIITGVTRDETITVEVVSDKKDS
jgi:hypothetical protein